jgi:hypothetical protein
MLAEIEKVMYDSISIKDINNATVMAGLLDQLTNTPQRRLVNFLEKLDPARFRKAATHARNLSDLFHSGISIGLNGSGDVAIKDEEDE